MPLDGFLYQDWTPMPNPALLTAPWNAFLRSPMGSMLCQAGLRHICLVKGHLLLNLHFLIFFTLTQIWSKVTWSITTTKTIVDMAAVTSRCNCLNATHGSNRNIGVVQLNKATHIWSRPPIHGCGTCKNQSGNHNPWVHGQNLVIPYFHTRTHFEKPCECSLEYTFISGIYCSSVGH